MKKDIAMKWIKALESGQYTQISGRLTRNNSYCCLGVLCKITNSKKWKYQNVLPNHVMNKTEMNSQNGEFNLTNSLADLNDNGLSFKEIAKTIRKNWKKL